MGMRASYIEVGPDDASKVLNEPSYAAELLMGSALDSDFSILNQMVQQSLSSGKDLTAIANEMLQQSLSKSPIAGGSAKGETESHPTLELEKSWQAIHFVLNGDPWQGSGPLFNVVLGGQEVGEDMGYGCPRYINPVEVSQASTALEAISDQKFSEMVKATDFAGNEIYVCSNERIDAIEEELSHYFKQIKKFFKNAADKGNGILTGII